MFTANFNQPGNTGQTTGMTGQTGTAGGGLFNQQANPGMAMNQPQQGQFTNTQQQGGFTNQGQTQPAQTMAFGGQQNTGGGMFGQNSTAGNQAGGMMGGQTGAQGGLFANKPMMANNTSMMGNNQGSMMGNQSMMANQNVSGFANVNTSQFGGNMTGMAPSLDNMHFINQHSFLPSFQNKDFGTNERGEKNKDQKDQGELKKFAFMYEELQGTVFQLSELNPYKTSSVNELDAHYKDIILNIEENIKNNGKNLEKLKANNEEMQKSLEEKLEVSQFNNLSLQKTCNLKIAKLGRNLLELDREMVYFKRVTNEFEKNLEYITTGRNNTYTIPSDNLLNIVNYIKDKIEFLGAIMQDLTDSINCSVKDENGQNETTMGVYAQVLQELYTYMIQVMNKSVSLTNSINRCKGIIGKNDSWNKSNTTSMMNQEDVRHKNLHNLEELVFHKNN